MIKSSPHKVTRTPANIPFSKYLNEVNRYLQEALFFLKNMDDEGSVEQFFVLRHQFTVDKVDYKVYVEEKEDAPAEPEDSENTMLIYMMLVS